MQAPELQNPTGFINTEPIKLKELKGKKVILLDFWTFSCINCQRVTPYLNAWYEKYKDLGLEIIGVHTPEFDFEKEVKNVEGAVKQYGIKYPVVVDSDYDTWNAYGNRYWPRKYLISIDGKIIYDHIGEGGYAETEKKIQKALQERAKKLNLKLDIPHLTTQVHDAHLEPEANSPEIYFGSARNSYLGNGQQGEAGEQILQNPKGIKTNILYLVGHWQFESEYAQNNSENAKIIFRYHAKNVFMVASSESEVELEVKWDDRMPPKEIAGADVKNGVIKIKEPRLYKLIEGTKKAEEHTLELTAKQTGLKIFTFTFG